MAFNVTAVLEWSALAVALSWVVGCWSILAGSRRAKRAFRGKGYLRPPSGKAWIRFLYYQHYDAFEDSSIRFYYKVARTCLFLSVSIVVALAIFMGLLLILTETGRETRPPADYRQ
jgi:hypothetical protein